MKRIGKGVTRRTALELVGGAGLLLSAGIAPAAADQLEDILAAGKIRIGSDTANPPFGMLNESMEAYGSDIEVAQALAADLGVDLETIPTVNATRVPNLQTNRADVIISAMSITPERAKVIDFSRPYSAIGSVVGALKDAEISGLEDMRGKTVAVTRAGVSDTLMTGSSKDYDLTVQRYEDDATLITAAVSGQATLVSTSRNILNEINRRNENFETKFEDASYDIGMGIRKGETALKDRIDAWILENIQNGRLNEIYKKYHLVDLPERIREQA
ncbi:transporter substrate-binding domain-containing protein [Celeribacter indicus]|uniref:Extracellular solute-binding protein n=1 Tax=Celeribacter indicus TaxID=1208324 RepID=A0A0B5DTL3_9RHOB|nr:transporter substrate-binding domain-containing protein [Celeribacter indicus]AJE46773.1 extracellular solute-binding protein [Celeribacter indicus]SDX06068.1 amino acid ABC transporter substrate-binding protein, PAAT family [Celeribacter indicus]